MSAVGGDVTEVKWSHPTLGSGVLYPKAGETSSFDPGGFRSNDDAQGIDGSGAMIKQLTRARWSLDLVIAWDNNIRQELETLNNISGQPVDATFTVSHVSGAVYKGLGTVVGDVKGDGLAATIPIKFAGGNKLDKII